MELFYADLHIHSRYSRATSKRITPQHLAAWGWIKGLDVVATGDFTHPQWREELKELLVEEDSGLLRLKAPEALEGEIPWWLEGKSVPASTRFMLVTEISSIYKKGGKVRKIHNLVFMPSLEKAAHFSSRLAQVGNLASDGRPILGLDARHLLEMVLETDPLAFLIPAHIWTPWFSLFGSRSGFDSLEECFGDLSREIFALETGLSSDPEMNWLWSSLDRYRMVSNSDAHSGEKLGREANIFSGERSFEGMYRALRGEALGHKFLGTVEFFPEEGKYHMDGHRKCNVVLNPKETMARGGICPKCGHPVTVGVLHRVLELADRDYPKQPLGQPGYISLVPLTELLSEILGVGPKTKKVMNEYGRLIQRFGPEMTILQRTPLEDLGRHAAVLAEAVGRMRKGVVHRQPGFDGEYGTISVFSPRERKQIRSGGSLVEVPTGPDNFQGQQQDQASPATGEEERSGPAAAPYNAEQQGAIDAGPGPVLVMAGPGTGKTRTLIGRVQALLDHGVPPGSVLVLTFTRSAAREIKSRLQEVFGRELELPQADTLHALAYDYWVEMQGQAPVILNEEESRQVFQAANPELSGKALKRAWQALSRGRETGELPEEAREWGERYFGQKDNWNLVDYTDLLEFWLEQSRSEAFTSPYRHVLVDEVQDLSRQQLKVISGLVPEGGDGVFSIGDPDQSIYGFRGALSRCEEAIRDIWPGLTVVSLKDNYRSSQDILDFSRPLFPSSPRLSSRVDAAGSIALFEASTAQNEATWIGQRIRQLLGGTAHLDQDLGDAGGHSPEDIAVLVRFRALIPPIERTLTRMGLPCSVPESEAFWVDSRVERILKAASLFLGVAEPTEHDALQCPDEVLARGPAGLAAYLEDVPPFDRMFWKSQPFKELSKAFAEHGGWAGLLNWIHLQSELELVRRRSEKVRIMTMHAAKGLEFATVFMPALEDGLVPFAGMELLTGKLGDATDRPDEEEEKRLFYVGLTRARQNLFLSYASRRDIYGRVHQLRPSRFLDLLPGGLMERSVHVARLIRRERQLSLL
ncbi:MAG: UvrD-helicase domain-containing protein [Desulfohalobiaceae bacterium]